MERRNSDVLKALVQCKSQIGVSVAVNLALVYTASRIE